MMVIGFISLLAGMYNLLGFEKDIDGGSKIDQDKNIAPVVKILAPLSDASFGWNSAVPYSISVSDKEDGESKFQEIPSQEVFLKVQYMKDLAKAQAYVKRKSHDDLQGVVLMEVSNCFNCHSMKTEKMGPSFLQISRKYAYASNNIQLLAGRIVKGSSGIWGTAIMPPHPDLTMEKAAEIVKWMMTNAPNADLNYYVGLNGIFKMQASGSPSGRSNGVVVLTAYYTDHGTKNNPGHWLSAQNVIIVHGK